MYRNSGAQQYAKLGVSTSVEDANPHKIIQLLFEKAQSCLHQALGSVDRNDYQSRGQHLGQVMNILSSLQGFLDHKKGGQIAQNLDGLYEYMLLRLHDANVDHDKKPIMEVSKLLGQIQEGWNGISKEAEKIFAKDGS